MLSEDSQEADKPVLPALGGDRGGGNVRNNFGCHFLTSLPSPLKRERQFACLRKRLIDKVLLYINKTFKRTLKKRTNQSSPLLIKSSRSEK